jgi:putative membrane protein insertion efficiency factor
MTETQHRRFRPVTAVAMGMLWTYQRTLSPLLYGLGVRCRHAPSCSAYSMEAFRRHGALRGTVLTVSRLARCHPWGSHGWDPTPESLPDAGWRVWRYGDWAWTGRPAASETQASVDTHS